MFRSKSNNLSELNFERMKWSCTVKLVARINCLKRLNSTCRKLTDVFHNSKTDLFSEYKDQGWYVGNNQKPENWVWNLRKSDNLTDVKNVFDWELTVKIWENCSSLDVVAINLWTVRSVKSTADAQNEKSINHSIKNWQNKKSNGIWQIRRCGNAVKRGGKCSNNKNKKNWGQDGVCLRQGRSFILFAKKRPGWIRPVQLSFIGAF